jgi:hypothetical protein
MDWPCRPAACERRSRNTWRCRRHPQRSSRDLKALAERSVATALADPALRAALVGCTPSGPSDAVCLRDFIQRLGRRALRRPLDDAEVQEYQRFQSFAIASGDFYAAASIR